ncbi:MAG: NADH-quinone oxidoreductase subunit L [Deltaproteobacteria bacterium]|nr:NADH-quinone oxidoreductase subunit L [Deltaproteobacteria bacterium]
MESLVLGLPLAAFVALLPLLPLLGAFLNGIVAVLCRSGLREVPKALVSLIGVGLPLGAFGLTLLLFSLAKNPAAGTSTAPLWTWIAFDDFAAHVAFKVDRLSLTLSLVVTGVGSLIHLYSVGYMSHDKGFARYFSYLNLFLFSMLVLVLAGNLPLMFVGWEGVGLCSYLLIGFWFEDPAKAYAGKKAFIVNRIGDLGFLLGMFVLYTVLVKKGVASPHGLLSFDILQQYRTELSGVATLACLLLFTGAVGKSAQIPLYVWLPDAMAGPTPVSALIHAATMVTAGIYMIARLHFLYTLSPVAMEVVAVIGASTAFFAATIGLVQRDIKKVLAYSTVSQLGYMFLALGVGAFSAAIFHLVTHAFFKACLFLGSGSVIHALSGEQDIWKMGGLRKRMPVTFATFFMATLAIVGLFPFAGFFSKDAILFQTFATNHKILWGVGFVTAGLTAFYMSRLLTVVFLGSNRTEKEKLAHLHESPLSMTIPLILLGLLSLGGGWMAIPEALHGGDHFFKWLAPLFPYEHFFDLLEVAGHGLELLFSVVTLLWVFHLGLITMILYAQKPAIMDRLAGRFRRLHKILEEKYYLDEIYNFLVVRSIESFSRVVLWRFHDEKVVDGLLVHGSAETVGLMGRTLNLLQTGVVQNYALFFIVGVIFLIACVIL